MNQQERILLRAEELHRQLTAAFPDIEWDIKQWARDRKTGCSKWSLTAFERAQKGER